MADLVHLPRRAAESAVAGVGSLAGSVASSAASALGDAARLPMRTLWPAHAVDDWGRDAHLIESMWPLVELRWKSVVGGQHHIPSRNGALLVTNVRRWSMSPMMVALALSRSTGRAVRFVGRPDSAPIGAALRRLGGLLDDPAEVEGALRDHQLVVAGAAPTAQSRHAGAVDHEIIGAAVLAGVPVLPVASMSSPLGRAARAQVGAAVRNRHKRRGPLAEVELAEAVQRSLQKLLDEMGGVRTGIEPIDWLGEG